MKEYKIAEAKLSHTISAGDLSVDISVLPKGLTLHEITDHKSGYSFLCKMDSQPASPLLTLTARRIDKKEFLTVTSADGWEKVSAVEGSSVHTFVLSEHERLPAVKIILTAAAEEEQIIWTVRIDSKNPDYSLYECDYPILAFDGCNKTKVFFPYGCGEVYSSVKSFSSVQNYPSYGASMEYMAFWNEEIGRGIYYGLHDPAPAYKKLAFCKEEGNSLAILKASMPLCDITQPGNSQTLEGENVWQLFNGDWYDGALIYQKFFQQYASWKPVIREGKRIDTPEWLRTNPHWWRKRMLLILIIFRRRMLFCQE